ncbi:MAG: ABC transporter ATP-binding protein [Bacillota bacterium]
MPDALLDIQRLRIAFATESGLLQAVNGIDLTVGPGETVGLVGESGCGKSVTSLAVMRLIPSPPGVVRADRLTFQGQDILALSDGQMQRVRGNRMAMIFQEPMTSLNPVFTVGDQIGEVFQLHGGLSRTAARDAAVDMLRLVGVPDPGRRVKEFPHQMSGGMRQRVMIAMALACRPALLIADEPTTALDVTIQAQILELLKGLQRDLGMALLLITHDLGVVAETTQRVYVMYAGNIVEEARVGDLFSEPLHPYTMGLLASLPRLREDLDELRPIGGSVPHPSRFPPGCRFHPRCNEATDICRHQPPELVAMGERRVRCWQRLAKGGAGS